MVNQCLLYFLGFNKILDPLQSGFRGGRSTINHLVLIETDILDAFMHQQFFLSVFLDMEKTYDTTWCFGILPDIAGMGVWGSLLNVIQSYLSYRTFRVSVGNVLSHPFTHEAGVPRGGGLSCTLFIVRINSLHTVIPHTMFYSVYVDNIQIGYKSCNLNIWATGTAWLK